MRKFKTWAVRDVSNGKLNYYWFTHPLVEHSFARYMKKHQTCSDWTIREANNWWWWWSTDVSIDSLTRHVKDLEALHAWYIVIKVRSKNKKTEETFFITEEQYKNIEFADWTTIELVTKEDCLNAIRFNCWAYLLQELDDTMR